MPIMVRDLGFSYFDRDVLRDVVFTLNEGAIHLVLGMTGSGKSTLALILTGLLRPKCGSVYVDGCDPASDKFERSRLQLAFQFPEAQILETSVEREIEYGLKNFGLSSEEVPGRRQWAIECVGLGDHLLSRDPAEISFGERRKVALASTIALKPKYLILDEPLAGLDWHGRSNLVDTLRRLKDQGLTTLVLTHEADLVAEMGDTVSFLVRGRFVGPMSPEEFLTLDEASGRTGDSGHELLPEPFRALHRMRTLGYPVGAGPRKISDVAAAMIRALRHAGSRHGQAG